MDGIIMAMGGGHVPRFGINHCTVRKSALMIRKVRRSKGVCCFSQKTDVVENACSLKDLPLPEGDFGLPIIGQSLDFINNNMDFFDKRREELGPVFKASVLGKPTVFVYGAEDINKVLSLRPSVLGQDTIPSLAALAGDQALVNKDGLEHARLRRLATSTLTPSAMAKYLPLIEQESCRSLQRWSETQGPVRFADEIHKFVCTIASDCILGLTSASKSNEEMLGIYTTWWSGLISLGINLPFTKFGKALRAREEILEIIQENIRIVRRGGGREGMALSTLINARDEDGSGLTERQLEDMILTLVLASYTTASALSYLLQDLQAHPQVLEKATAEQERIIAEYGEEMTMESIHSMKYLDAVIKETMRLDNIAPWGFRKSVRSFELNGYRIPENWQILLGYGSSSLLDERWPGDTEYNPDRFLTPEGAKPGAQLQWGVGPRVCLGKSLAVLEMQVLLGQLLRGYGFRTMSDSVIIPGQPKDGMPIDFWKKQG